VFCSSTVSMQDVRKTVLASLPACETMVTEIVARTHDVNHEVRTKWSCAVILLGFELPALLETYVDKAAFCCFSFVDRLQTSCWLHLWQANCRITQSTLHVVQSCTRLSCQVKPK